MNDVNHANNHQPNSTVAPIFLRLFWMIFGNMLLLITALLIVQTGKTFSFLDILYALTVPALLLARYYDIARYKGTTAAGEPASISDWKQYSLRLLPLTVGIWLAAHGAAYLITP